MEGGAPTPPNSLTMMWSAMSWVIFLFCTDVCKALLSDVTSPHQSNQWRKKGCCVAESLCCMGRERGRGRLPHVLIPLLPERFHTAEARRLEGSFEQSKQTNKQTNKKKKCSDSNFKRAKNPSSQPRDLFGNMTAPPLPPPPTSTRTFPHTAKGREMCKTVWLQCGWMWGGN